MQIICLMYVLIVQHTANICVNDPLYCTFAYILVTILPTGMDTLGMHDWQTTDIEVRIKETHDDSGLIGQTGIIRGVSVRSLSFTCFVLIAL